MEKPKDLPAALEASYDRLYPLLTKNKTLNELTVDDFVRYLYLDFDFKACSIQLSKCIQSGNISDAKVLSSMQNDLLVQLKQLSQKFGLTAARK